jgi:pimeloyl-ACP methyl ester carboxylesterase/predicted small secreted protein
MKLFRTASLVAMLATTSLLLTSCSAVNGFFHGTEPTALPSAIAETAPTPELQSYYSQPLELVECNGNFMCGNITVPLDYADPTGSQITLAVIFAAAQGNKPLGTVFFNPGGPGASGVQWIKDGYDQLGTTRLRNNFNIVGFDPRGVGGSSPVKCLTPKETDELLYAPQTDPIGSPADIKSTIAQAKKFAAGCQKQSTKILPHVDTVSAARDLDILRSVFGDKKLNYLGYSYGTFLGETYATLFPQKVGHLVLDGVVDPTLTNDQQSLAQLKGFDHELKAFLADCLKNSKKVTCPFKGNLKNALATVKATLVYLETHDVATSDAKRPLTIWSAETGMMMALYATGYWEYLRAGFDQLLNESDGSTLLALADLYNDRDAKGNYSSNTLEANTAISCLDDRSSADMADMLAQNKRLLKISPTLGRYWSFGALMCSVWPYPVVQHPESYAAEGSAPILVVGTTGDPATPYSQAVNVANNVLANGHLVTWKGDGHTAYGRSNSCVANAVDDYFIESVVPKRDPMC